MSGRYWITGVQLGILQAYAKKGMCEAIAELVSTVADEQFIGNIPPRPADEPFDITTASKYTTDPNEPYKPVRTVWQVSHRGFYLGPTDDAVEAEMWKEFDTLEEARAFYWLILLRIAFLRQGVQK